MYYNRQLSTEELLYVSRAQQRIIVLSQQLSKEHNNNDVDELKVELILELEYSINILKSSVLSWCYEDIRMMMDYYTIRAELVTFPYRAISFNPINAIPGGTIWATVPQLNAEAQAREDYDNYLLSLLQQEIEDRIGGDNYLLNLITNNSGGVTTVQITAEEDIGGIRKGTVFPIGTPLENILRALLAAPAKVKNLTFNTFSEVKETGQNIAFGAFTWEVEGEPINLRLNGPGFTNQAVTGSTYNTSVIVPAINGEMTWILSGGNIDPVSITLHGVFPSYFGKEVTSDDNPITVNEAKVLSGTKYVQRTLNEVSVVANTGTTEQGFIAVPKNQTVSSYTKWFVDNTNFSNIETGEFIRPSIEVLVSGTTYQVYRWGYRSPLNNTLKLHR